MSAKETGTHSTAERRAAEAEVRSLVAAFAPAHERLVATVRRWLRKRLPTAHELAYEYTDAVVISFSPDERGYEGVVAVRASASGVLLYLNRGAELRDPEKLLRGSGKLARSLEVGGASTLARPAVASLVDAAIARSAVPFATTGRGAVVIRSTAARKRRPRRPA